ncbi:MAG: carbohydrate ABC transporter substrate-binding protein [Chloroflexi bacterium]|nr:MAG: carbohydrate ABC transporter substrate-binding protein [Chloroflexota bacterium]
MSNNWTRREFVKKTGTAAGALVLGGAFADFLAACASGTTGGGETNLEIFSWWTAGGEADGLAEMFKIYKNKYSSVKIINAAVAGGAGSNAKAVLATRMQGGKPPDSFQVHAGQELISTWVKADKMEPITSIWNSEGWDSVMPKDLKTIVSKGSDVWSVPVNVHRGNALWVNLAKAGSAITPGTGNNLDNFLSALGKAKAAGMAAPLALGSKGNWQVTMLFENNLVAVGGANFYRGLFTGASSWTDPNIKTALNYVKSMLNYVNSDNATIDWDQASGRVQAGTSVVTIMGDWAKGYFTANNWKPDTDFTGIASPGTEKTYMIVCDTFGLPKGAPDRANAINWIKVCGSQEGQAAFNPKKGSIPARTDVSPSIFDSIAQKFIAEFKTDSLTPSIAHGSAAPEAFASGLNDEMGQFVQKRDVNGSATNIAKLADQFLK